MVSTIKFPHTLPTRETIVTAYEWCIFNRVLCQIDADIVIKSNIVILEFGNEENSCKPATDVGCRA